MLHTGTEIPALAASVRATASHKTIFTSSASFGNLAIANWPSRSGAESPIAPKRQRAAARTRMKWTRTQFQRRLKRKALRMRKPVLVVFECGAFPVLAGAHPQSSHPVRCALQVQKNEDFIFHCYAPCFPEASSGAASECAQADALLPAHAQPCRAGDLPRRRSGHSCQA